MTDYKFDEADTAFSKIFGDIDGAVQKGRICFFLSHFKLIIFVNAELYSNLNF